MYDGVGVGEELVDECCIGDVVFDECDVVFGEVF